MNKHRNSMEDTVSFLRKEVNSLYQLLKDKNEQLMEFEKLIRDKDITISILQSDLKNLKDSKRNGSSHAIEFDRQPNTSSSDDPVKIELNCKVLRMSEELTAIQKDSMEKDYLIVDLKNEIDKFRQVVRPLTQAFLEQKKSDSLDWHPGVESTRVFNFNGEQRMKRQGFSAEPLSQMSGNEVGELVKIPKSSL